MGDPTTIALNLTFFGTLAVGLVMFFGLFLVFVATLVIAGLGRLGALSVMGVGRVLLGTDRAAAEPRQHGGTVPVAAPAVKVSVRELPDPAAPARDLTAVAPLVESATDPNGRTGTVPPAFKKVPATAANSLLDTGSLVSRQDRLPPLRTSPLSRPSAPDQQRKAG